MAVYKDVEPLTRHITEFKQTVGDDKRFSNDYGYYSSDYITGYLSALSVISGLLASQSEVDVVKAVRCKDCRFCSTRQESSHGRPVHFCSLHTTTVPKMGFCNAGRSKHTVKKERH